MRNVTPSPGAADSTIAPVQPARTWRLWIELTALFVGVPVLMATVMPPRYAFSVLIAMTAVAVFLLTITPGFQWRSLQEGGLGRHWRDTLGFIALSAALLVGLALWLRPHAFLGLPLHRTELWLAIIALYPVLSVLPQELIYRPLFFARYGDLFPHSAAAIAANTVLFAIAHSFYHNWPAVLLTGVGGAAFAWAYVVRRSFPLACLWHAVAGQLIFTVGLGTYFYHGVIVR